MSPRRRDAVVIGAGPYGLAAAALLRRAGVDAHVFGEPMSFWQRHMPKGMFLRSPWAASHIGDRRAVPTLDEFQQARGSSIARPVPLADFVAYGRWFQEHEVPDVDPRHVERVEPADAGYRVVLADGEPIECTRVVVAAGISAFAWRPPEFADLSPDVASHSSEHADLERFAGSRVVVIGGGQSALESAALLREAGADVEVIMRAPRLHWVGRATRRGVLGRLLFDRTDVGPALVSHLVARPDLLRRLPRTIQHKARVRSLAPGGALWLRPRLLDIPITVGRRVVQAARPNGHLQLTLDDAATREADHVLLATGYRVDVRRYRFLAPALADRLRCIDGHPILDEGLRSPGTGLHFLGAPAAYSFGPLVRFVAGTEFSSRALVRSVTARRERWTDPVVADRAFDMRSERPTP